MNTKIIDVGDSVQCDICFEEYRERDNQGGFLVGSYSLCPKCAPRIIERIKANGEERAIRARCPAGMSFHAWVMSLRGGDNTIKITTP